MEKDSIILFDDKSDCCGCAACYSVCPQKAILLKKDNEGFEYPIIDKGKCIHCKMCLNVCPLKNNN